MIQLSVNVNKIATLRNSRGQNIPNVLQFCKIVLDAGAHGITIHPREDQRHITKQDIFEIKDFLVHYNKTASFYREFNMEGEPSPRFLDLVLQAKPDQSTWVPVRPGEITSDHGFQLENDTERKNLAPLLQEVQKAKIRSALFLEAGTKSLALAKELGADRIELYTGPFAEAMDQSESLGQKAFQSWVQTAEEAHTLGLGINAGHDLDSRNLLLFRNLPHLKEVSIGHRLMAEALEIGMEKTVKKYLSILSKEI